MQKNKGLIRILKAARYSWQGICAAYRWEAAFRQEFWAAVVMIPLAFWLDVSSVERILLIASVLLVLVVELLNSAIEALVDRVGTDYHELSGRAKDMGSAAVFIALGITAVTWGIVIFS